MEKLRALRVYVVPVIGLLSMAVIVVLHRAPVPDVAVVVRKERAETPVPAALPKSPPPSPVKAPSPPKTMPGEEARIYDVYQDFKTAIALDHGAHRDALYPVLARSRAAAVRLAEADLQAAPDGASREIAIKTLTALRR